jgi:hypothetical protein
MTTRIIQSAEGVRVIRSAVLPLFRFPRWDFSDPSSFTFNLWTGVL